MDSEKIRTRAWRNGTLEAENFAFEQLSDYLEDPDCLVWADILRPGDHTVRQLAEELSLDPHSVEDAVGSHERPKVTRYSTHLFLTAYALGHDDATDITLGRVSAFSTHRAFVTVRLDDLLDIDSVVQRWDRNADLLKFGPRALAHGLLDQLVDDYFIALEALDDAVDGIEDILFDETGKSSADVSQKTFRLHRSLMRARRAVVPMRDVISTLTHRPGEDGPPSELTPYYADLYDHALRAGDWTDSLREIITSIFDTNMSMSDTRMNLVMKKLTAWAAIIAVPTAITGFYGQNVPYPGFDRSWGFWVSIVSIVLIAFVLYVSFKRRDWL